MANEIILSVIAAVSAVSVAAVPVALNNRNRTRKVQAAVGEKNGQGSLIEIVERIEDALHRVEDHVLQNRKSINKIDDRVTDLETQDE